MVRERDEQSGTSKVFQNIFDEQGEPKGLAGAFFCDHQPRGRLRIRFLGPVFAEMTQLAFFGVWRTVGLQSFRN